MLKKMMAATVFLISTSAMAMPSVEGAMTEIQVNLLQTLSAKGLDWKVGDENNYALDMGFLKGTMKMSVREMGADGIWVDQDVDLSIQKQTSSILMDSNTGAIKKILVNGQEQQIPENNFKPIDVNEDKVTVPAGTFDCIYAKLKDEKTGKEAQAWINPQLVSVGGSLKMIQPSQLGNVTIVLTSFKKN